MAVVEKLRYQICLSFPSDQSNCYPGNQGSGDDNSSIVAAILALIAIPDSIFFFNMSCKFYLFDVYPLINKH